MRNTVTKIALSHEGEFRGSCLLLTLTRKTIVFDAVIEFGDGSAIVATLKEAEQDLFWIWMTPL